MVYELRVKSFERLFEELKGLDVDTGIRALGEFEGRKSLIFITRHSGKYALWIRDRSRRSGAQGVILDFHGYGELRRFLEETLDKPIKAHMY